MRILGIESSCDETAASIIEGKGDRVTMVTNIVASQVHIHKKFGGVVPEVAARNHILKILPVIEKALKNNSKIDAIAVTQGPGLIPSLIVGLETAKALAYTWNTPLIGVNHMAGHVYSAWVDLPHEMSPSDNFAKGKIISQGKPKFPALILIVSGGHTELVLMRDHLKFKKIGETRDDAAGEAFDKVAKMLELGYPGGPAVSKQAKLGDAKKIPMPRPMIHDDNYDFSFSGLKTAVLYHKQKNQNWRKDINNYCATFQQAVIDVLVKKTLKAAKQYKVKSIILAGGVSANSALRKQLGEAIATNLPKTSYHLPEMAYTTDNAAMIAAAGYFMARQKKYTKFNKLTVDCNLSL